MSLFDTHSHYFDEKFLPEAERDALLHEILTNSPVKEILHAGTSPENSRTCVELAKRFPNTYAAVGMHPGDCRDVPYTDGAIAALEALLKEPETVAVGEIGFDFHWQPYDRDHQARWFEAQMVLARETGMPVVIHDREAHGATLDVIRAFPSVTGVLHCYSGSAEMVPELIKRGWYFSFAGVITYKNAAKTVDALRAVPNERLVIETDCPYLAPVPFRHKRNCSLYLEQTARVAAELRGCDYDEFCAMTTQNAHRLFRIGG